MNITILSVGKLKEKYLTEAVLEYSKRLGRYVRLEIIELQDEQTPDKVNPALEALVKEKEGERVQKAIRSDSYVIALAIEGKKMSSVQFAQKIEELGIRGNSRITFIIGGSLGLDEAVLKRADFLLSFSDMTFPHQLMRVILLEQIYRSFRIIHGEPYHK